YGDGFGANPDGLTLAKLKAAPHGIDYGPLEPRIPEVLRTASGNVELAPPDVVADVARLRESLDRSDDTLLLIGRRHLRSNNSCMPTRPALRAGSNGRTLQAPPDDQKRLGLNDSALTTGPAGKLRVPVEVTDAIRRGVVCLPHGGGHDYPDPRLEVAS